MLNERELAALGALLQARDIFRNVLPRFDWGRAFLRAEDIDALNRAPAAVQQAIKLLTDRSQS